MPKKESPTPPGEGETRGLLMQSVDSARVPASAPPPRYSSLSDDDDDGNGGDFLDPRGTGSLDLGGKGEEDGARRSSRRGMTPMMAALVCFVASVSMLTVVAMYRGRSAAADDAPQLRSASPVATATPSADDDDDDDDDDFAAKMKLYSSITRNAPLSLKSPSQLGIPTYSRESSRPGSVFGAVRDGAAVGVPLPTNEWYLNLVVGLDDDPGPDGAYANYAGEENRVHTIPYILDTVGPVVGIRLHYPNVLSYGTVVESVLVPSHGLALGTTADGGAGAGERGGCGRFTRRYEVDEDTLPSKLGVRLRWEETGDGCGGSAGGGGGGPPPSTRRRMRSSVLRGMPYGTMEYAPGVVPIVASEAAVSPDRMPLVDGTERMECGTLGPNGGDDGVLARPTGTRVEREVELFFPESDFTWLVLFSRPARVRCYVDPERTAGGSASLPPGAVPAKDVRSAFQLRADPENDDGGLGGDDDPLVVRIALANNCTLGTNVNFCRRREPRDQSAFASVLREHAGTYPTSPVVRYAFPEPEIGLTPEAPDGTGAYLFFDWAPESFRGRAQVPNDERKEGPSNEELIMFALPHHVDVLRGMDGRSSNEVIGHCVHSLHGNACLVKGGLWAMEEELDGLPSFMAPRPPNHLTIPALANALSRDISYSLPDNYMRGGGDTYFSGKMLAKLGRIIVIAQELRGLAETPDEDVPDDSSTPDGQELARIIHKCKEVNLPTEEEVSHAIDRLRRGVEVWLNGEAEARYTFDDAWGGLVNCGCTWNGDGCSNVFPDCPSYADPGLNFGNGYYNDHHFHYGYHIYAAAVAARYDREWGRRYFERVTLYVRDIANPSAEDGHFPAFRQKDWYLGNSWASGIALVGGRPYANGRNQESSSEAIAAYEGIAMFGSVMMKSFGNGRSSSPSDNENALTACRIFNLGRFLAATEIRSADRYWHVYSPKRYQIYPDSYTPAVVSMMWDTMCQFQTWFGSAPYLAYGIQLLPLSPISERRDTDQWLRQMYPSFAESCDSDEACINEGWAVLLYAALASLGHREMAVEKTLALPEEVFTSAGGSGHSLTNTLWYISTRPIPEIPYDLQNPSTSINSKVVTKSDENRKIDCGCPDTCTRMALKTRVGGFACGERILWLMANEGLGELGACSEVAGKEHRSECGACDPALCGAGLDTAARAGEGAPSSGCPPCDVHVCTSGMNSCQISTTPYLCYEGTGRGGCSATPWETGDGSHCSACCELFEGCDVSTLPDRYVPGDVQNPLDSTESQVPKSEKEDVIDCGCPATCDSKALDLNAGGLTCKERIQLILNSSGLDERGACRQVAGDEYHSECSACDPEACSSGLDTAQVDETVSSGCPPCDVNVCNSEMNQCPVTSAPHLCYEGSALGGCSALPWITSEGAPCSACCELFDGCEG